MWRRPPKEPPRKCFIALVEVNSTAYITPACKFDIAYVAVDEDGGLHVMDPNDHDNLEEWGWEYKHVSWIADAPKWHEFDTDEERPNDEG